jgi:hypothetical protein
MIVRAEISEDGTVKVKNPQSWLGKNVQLTLDEDKINETMNPNGEAILNAFQKSDALPIHRKNHDELTRILHEVRD